MAENRLTRRNKNAIRSLTINDRSKFLWPASKIDFAGASRYDISAWQGFHRHCWDVELAPLSGINTNSLIPYRLSNPNIVLNQPQFTHHEHQSHPNLTISKTIQIRLRNINSQHSSITKNNQFSNGAIIKHTECRRTILHTPQFWCQNASNHEPRNCSQTISPRKTSWGDDPGFTTHKWKPFQKICQQTITSSSWATHPPPTHDPREVSQPIFQLYVEFTMVSFTGKTL